MKRKLILVFALLLLPVFLASGVAGPFTGATSPPFETRCGWFSNPTPANVSLYDREAEWIIGVQGGYEVEGDWPWPEFKEAQWVTTNAGSYGYGCACMQLKVDRRTKHVLEIKTAKVRPLAKCRQDAALKKWDRVLEVGL